MSDAKRESPPRGMLRTATLGSRARVARSQDRLIDAWVLSYKRMGDLPILHAPSQTVTPRSNTGRSAARSHPLFLARLRSFALIRGKTNQTVTRIANKAAATAMLAALFLRMICETR
jgi:hypothetical protein